MRPLSSLVFACAGAPRALVRASQLIQRLVQPWPGSDLTPTHLLLCAAGWARRLPAGLQQSPKLLRHAAVLTRARGMTDLATEKFGFPFSLHKVWGKCLKAELKSGIVRLLCFIDPDIVTAVYSRSFDLRKCFCWADCEAEAVCEKYRQGPIATALNGDKGTGGVFTMAGWGMVVFLGHSGSKKWKYFFLEGRRKSTDTV